MSDILLKGQFILSFLDLIVSYVIFKVQMHQVWKRLAFQPGDGGLSHAPNIWAWHCQGEALPSELQAVQRSSNGEAQHPLREHRHPPGESGEEDKNQMLP